jgi:hypothetical protein
MASYPLMGLLSSGQEVVFFFFLHRRVRRPLLEFFCCAIDELCSLTQPFLCVSVLQSIPGVD